MLNCHLGTIGRSLADQFSEDQICSGQGFDLIIGASRHHFRSYLEAEPEVQAEIALYQSTRSPKGTFMEHTSRISNKLREMESGFKELLPPKLKGFIIKRQAKLTHDLAKHLHFYIPTRDSRQTRWLMLKTDLTRRTRLWNKYSETAKLEHHANRGHAQSNSHAQAYPMEAETTTSTESNHHHYNHKASSDTESDQLDWDPEKLMMTVIPWWTKTGPPWYPYHGKDLWTRMKRVR